MAPVAPQGQHRHRHRPRRPRLRRQLRRLRRLLRREKRKPPVAEAPRRHRRARLVVVVDAAGGREDLRAQPVGRRLRPEGGRRVRAPGDQRHERADQRVAGGVRRRAVPPDRQEPLVHRRKGMSGTRPTPAVEARMDRTHLSGGTPVPRTPPTAEHQRLAEADAGLRPWRKWGPYLSERQWGTVREDYSADGNAWAYFPHDHARSRTYRWGEDGIAGFSDDQQQV